MKITDIPSRFPVPFGSSAGVGYIRAIPTTPTGTPGQASLQTGFPPANFSPLNAGGVPPFGQDMNGILNRATAWNQWQATGTFPPYDSSFQTDIGGYPAGACVASLVQFGLIWLSLIDDNVTNPDTGGAGWYRYFQIISTNTDLYVNAATGNDANNGLSPATALKTMQAAISRAYGFPPSQYTITIHASDGTYDRVVTPSFGGPNVIIDGNSTTPGNVIIDGLSAGSAVQLQGPNTLQVNNLRVQTALGYGFTVGQGGTLTTQNTESGACAGPVFSAVGGILQPGNHKFAGNCESMFYTTNNGYIPLLAGVAFVVSTPISVSVATVQANSNGSIQAASPPPSFSGSAVTGKRYAATLNGVINTQGAGATYFPGTIAGTTSTGGQYV